MKKKSTSPIVKETIVRLGKNIRNKLGILTPMQCKSCGGVWKKVETWKRGRKVIRKRVTCHHCGKRQYGKRAQV